MTVRPAGEVLSAGMTTAWICSPNGWFTAIGTGGTGSAARGMNRRCLTRCWTGFGKILRTNHQVLLPMVYDDNEQLMRDLAEASGTEVERYPGTTGELPPDKLMQNLPDV